MFGFFTNTFDMPAFKPRQTKKQIEKPDVFVTLNMLWSFNNLNNNIHDMLRLAHGKTKANKLVWFNTNLLNLLTMRQTTERFSCINTLLSATERRHVHLIMSSHNPAQTMVLAMAAKVPSFRLKFLRDNLKQIRNLDKDFRC